MKKVDTIAAQATPAGQGGIAIVRVSGPAVKSLIAKVLRLNKQNVVAYDKTIIEPRVATFCTFMDGAHKIIDKGLAIYFPGPNSFTGEDVLELHCHGSPLVVSCLLARIFELGVRPANPGEFTERAFLNGKLDLTQAEAISDVINAASHHALQAALHTMQGGLARNINNINKQLIALRTKVEASIDFTEQDIEIITQQDLMAALQQLINQINTIYTTAQTGVILQEGLQVVIAGAPNVGKSSLLNYFSGRDSAIVTNIPGTTRDLVREYINIDGLPLHIIDTAGLRSSDDPIEQTGITKTWQAIEQADLVLLLTDRDEIDLSAYQAIKPKLLIVRNKIDLSGQQPQCKQMQHIDAVYISVTENLGCDLLRDYIKRKAGLSNYHEGVFMARSRHVHALRQAADFLQAAHQHCQHRQALELVAEHLRLAHHQLGEITGEFYSDDLLEQIFSKFCVGK